MSDDTVVALKDAIDRFRATFEKSGGDLLVSEEPAEPLSEDEVEREGIKKRPVAPPPAEKQ